MKVHLINLLWTRVTPVVCVKQKNNNIYIERYRQTNDSVSISGFFFLLVFNISFALLVVEAIASIYNIFFCHICSFKSLFIFLFGLTNSHYQYKILGLFVYGWPRMGHTIAEMVLVDTEGPSRRTETFSKSNTCTNQNGWKIKS